VDANAAPNTDEYMDDRLSPSGESPWYVSYCLTLFCIRMLRGLQVNFQDCVRTPTHIPGKIVIPEKMMFYSKLLVAVHLMHL